RALLPSSAGDLLPELDGACAEVRARLSGLATPDVGGDAAGAGDVTVEAAARAVLDEAIAALVPEAAALAGGLVDPEPLAARLRTAQRLDALRSDFAAHRDELAPFFAEHLLGVQPTVLG